MHIYMHIYAYILLLISLSFAVRIFLLQMTKIVLPEMEARRKGVILNISSASALRPAAMLTVYSAAKVRVLTQ